MNSNPLKLNTELINKFDKLMDKIKNNTAYVADNPKAVERFFYLRYCYYDYHDSVDVHMHLKSSEIKLKRAIIDFEFIFGHLLESPQPTTEKVKHETELDESDIFGIADRVLHPPGGQD